MKKLKNNIEIIGLDLSLTGTGWCRFFTSTEPIEYGEIITKPNEFPTRRARVNYIAFELYQFIVKQETPQIVFIEGYAFSKQTSSLTQLGELGGVIRQMVFSKTGIDAIEIPNTSLKKFITGSGQAKKEDLKLATYKKYYKKYGIDFQGKSNNECDAFCLAMMGKALLGLTDRLTKIEQDAVNKTYQHSRYTIDQAKEIIQ